MKAFAILLAALVAAASFGQGKATMAVGGIEYRAMDSESNKRLRAYGREPREDTRAFIDMITTALVKTNKFDVIERDRLGEIAQEQGIQAMSEGGFPTGVSVEGVDYILLGAITEYGTKAQAAQFGGFGGESETARMAVDVRVIDAHTGSIGFADTISKEVRTGGAFAIEGVASGGESDSSAALGEVMRVTAKGVTALIVSNIFPIKVVAVQANGEVMLNYGNALLGENDVLDVFTQGEAFIDPDTGEELGREETLAGKLQVTSVQDRFSKAVVIEGDGMEKGMLARITNEVVDAKGRKKTKKKRRKLF